MDEHFPREFTQFNPTTSGVNDLAGEGLQDGQFTNRNARPGNVNPYRSSANGYLPNTSLSEGLFGITEGTGPNIPACNYQTSFEVGSEYCTPDMRSPPQHMGPGIHNPVFGSASFNDAQFLGPREGYLLSLCSLDTSSAYDLPMNSIPAGHSNQAYGHSLTANASNDAAPGEDCNTDSPCAPVTSSDPPPSTYPPFRNRFKTSEEARAHRKRSRRSAKIDNRVAYVKTQRTYWVERLYTSMIATQNATDLASSCHLKRFLSPAFDPDDLEAAANHIFDAAIAVHERGWTRPLIYHREAVRGPLRDTCVNDVAARLGMICTLLEESKAAVNDAIQGGLSLARLVDNPNVRCKTKRDNNRTNTVRKRQLEAGIQALKKMKRDSRAEEEGGDHEGGAATATHNENVDFQVGGEEER